VLVESQATLSEHVVKPELWWWELEVSPGDKEVEYLEYCDASPDQESHVEIVASVLPFL
jgi:hypothetical protein